MPNTKAAHKALRQNEKRRVINLRRNRELKSLIKDFKQTAASGNSEEARAKLPSLYKALDKAAKSNLIKPNKASRLKSRLTKRLGGQAQEASTQSESGEGIESEA